MKMKLNENFILREIAGEVMLVPTGAEAAKINGFVAVNGVGAVILKKLSVGADINEIVQTVTDEFDTDAETALRDIEKFLDGLRKSGIVK